ncbi:type II secretion system protein N [Bordetella genomosp. 4]|uniref:type II secretion system protein N n=1 Tax=Bordetella genomosp. 4 TaxID=463044 RepID=UPI000B9EA5DD|nr:type II secretion system protein N [Bordetella genomosp. 4]OZI49461.1 general secretion pathway protein GspC [Bordetella genomosp. 4]
MRLRPTFTLPSAPRTVRVLAIAAAAAGVGLWSAILLAPAPNDLPPALNTSSAPVSDTRSVAMLFGTDGVLDTQITVLGLIAAGTQGSAVLSVDGAPARAYRIGTELAPGLSLVEVSTNGVELDRNGARLRVAAPKLSAVPAGIVAVP